MLQRSVVLLVDDDPCIRQVMTASLRGENLTILAASDAAGALRMLQKPAKIDLLLTDYHLGPGMDGLELAGCFLRAAPAAKVLLISGSPGAESRAREFGCGFLSKPFQPSALVGSVRQLLLKLAPQSDTAPPLSHRFRSTRS